MKKAKTGDSVRVLYSLSLENGTTFQPLHPGDTIDFTIGRGSVLRGFERAVLEMSKGERRKVRIPASEAYGPHFPEKLFTVPCRELLDQEISPVAGAVVRISSADEGEFFAIVREVDGDRVLLDANHPLCGQDVLFDIQLLEISRPAPRNAPAARRTLSAHPVSSMVV